MKELLDELREIKGLLAQQQTEYCDTRTAANLIGLDNPRDLKELYEKGVLPRYPRKGGFKYKKAECMKAAQLLDNGTIKLQTKKYANHN